MNQAQTVRFQAALEDVRQWGEHRGLKDLLTTLQEMDREDRTGDMLWDHERRAFKLVMHEMRKLFVTE